MIEYKTLQSGISDFRTLVQRNGYYVDKTPFIKRMEDFGDFLTILRPHQFGKSLFLSMLYYYYDIKERQNFDSLFRGTWIADNPTRERGAYQVLALDLSVVNGKTADEVMEVFNRHCCDRIDEFMERYKEFYPLRIYQEVLECNSFDKKMFRLGCYVDYDDIPLCLLIDEYDSFINTILSCEGEEVYRVINKLDRFYVDAFKLFKGIFQRVVVTGVCPIALTDFTGGFDITEDISRSEAFNRILGFTSEEIRQMVRYYKEKGEIQEDEATLMAELEAWYDGYCFATRCLKTDERMYNSAVVIRFIKEYLETGFTPGNLLDSKGSMVYTRLQQMIRLDRLNGNRRKDLVRIVQEGTVDREIEHAFPAEELTEPNLFPSLLYHYGMLTRVGGTPLFPVLDIPNKSVRLLLCECIKKECGKVE